MNKIRIGLFIWLMFFGNLVASQELGFQPEVDLSLTHDSNIYRTTSSVDDNVLLVKPNLEYVSHYGKHAFNAMYSGNYGIYSDNDFLNYTNHNVSLNALLEHSYKVSSEFKLTYQDRIEQPGSTNALSIQVNEFTEIKRSDVSASLFYGTQQSTGQFVVTYIHSLLEYENNEQNFRDYTRDSLLGAFYYKIAPQTRVLLEGNIVKSDYKNTEITDASSKQNIYSLGIEWLVSSSASSIFKIGYQNVEYDNSQLSDLSGLAYSLDTRWRPNSYTLIQLSADRAARESAEELFGGYISTEFGFNLAHELTFKTKINLSYEHTDFDFDNSQNRNDTLQDLSVKLSYQSKQWLNIYLELKNNKRSSTLEPYEYNANIIGVGALVSFD
ncbi:MAG: outer membrane beta-barrel protein [Paraglaciecola sp.]